MINTALTIEEFSKLIKDGFEYQGKAGRYHHFQKYETFGCGASIDGVLVPTDDVFTEMEAYLSHLKGISFESLKKTPYSELFSKKYKHGTVFVDVNDPKCMQSASQGCIEIDISTSGIPEEINPALPILFGIFESAGYRLYPCNKGTLLYKNGHRMRLGDHPLEDVKGEISFVDLTMTNFPEIAGNINAVLSSHKPQA